MEKCTEAAIEFVVFEGLNALPHHSPELHITGGLPESLLSGTSSLPLLTLTALEVQTVESESLSIEFSRSKVTPEGSVKDEATLDALKNCINALVSAARLKKQI